MKKLLQRWINPYAKLKAVKAKGTSALALFGKAYEQLEQANTELHALATDARKKASDLLKHADECQLEINDNRAAQLKLNQFVRGV